MLFLLLLNALSNDIDADKHPNKIKRHEIVDRISDLQDGLLLDILSRLDSTKEAIRTSVLSKRWEHLWPCVPSLTFHHPENNNLMHPDPDFFSFVNHTLTQCRQLNLNKFKLDTNYDIRFESLVNEWIRYSVNLNVKEFDLRLRTPIFEPSHTLDQICFINSNFTRLSLSECILKPTGGISWTNLKSLTLSCGKVDEDLIHNILSGSPMLETLNLIFGYGFRRIDISSKSVKNLLFAGFMDREQDPNTTHVIEINAPHIFSLKVNGLLIWSKLMLLNVCSLVKAELNYVSTSKIMYKEVEEEMLKELILKLPHVEELKIGSFCLEALSGLEAKGFTLPSNIKPVS
nr:hypothetical protein [Tanacetum cinerariifolium]